MIQTMLFLENGARRHTAGRLDQRFRDAGFGIDHYWAYNNEFPSSLDRYSGVFLTGSRYGAYDDVPFIHREHELIVESAEAKLPILGVCFGSQILASALCGRDQVFRRSTCEVGYKWLTVAPNYPSDPVTKDLGDRVYMFVWHNDEVRHDHPDMRILASSDLCPNQIWRYRNQPIWGIQGHPEISLDHATQWFEESRPYLEKDGADIDRLLASADEAVKAKTMLSNFLEVCRNQNR